MGVVAWIDTPDYEAYQKHFFKDNYEWLSENIISPFYIRDPSLQAIDRKIAQRALKLFIEYEQNFWKMEKDKLDYGNVELRMTRADPHQNGFDCFYISCKRQDHWDYEIIINENELVYGLHFYETGRTLSGPFFDTFTNALDIYMKIIPWDKLSLTGLEFLPEHM